MLTTIIIFIIILAMLVFVHEFGHFIVAKKSGMQVEEFGFGFPPRIAGVQKVDGKFKWIWGHKMPDNPTQTVYSINWIPLGGFVRILGENNEAEENPASFISKPFWPRFFTLVAGVVMNVIFAWVLLSVGFMINLSTEIDSPPAPPAHAIMTNPQIVAAEVDPGSPADKAHFMAGDIILKIDGVSYNDYANAVKYVRANAGKTLDFQINRNGAIEDINVVPQASSEVGGQGLIGMEMANIANLRYPWYYAFWVGGQATFYSVINLAQALYQLVSGQVSISNVGGPIFIAGLVGQARRAGFLTLLQLTAFISVNLAVINILPIPALDGGRVLFLIIEAVRRKRNNAKLEQWLNTTVFIALLVLILIISVHDVLRIIAQRAM